MKPGTRVLPLESPLQFQAALREAVLELQAGHVVALPTETVYGLAANALDSAAVGRIFAIKGRPAHNPIIVHVSSLAMARECTRVWPALADRLAKAFWPGPLTLVLPKSKAIPNLVTAGGDTVAVRWPRHAFIQAVIDGCGFPLAAPSANRSMQTSPTQAEHVRKSLGSSVQLIIDGGHCSVGIESTVLDLTTAPPRVLRPGMIHDESIAAVVGTLEEDARALPPTLDTPRTTLKSPGLLARHYAPQARLVVLSWADESELELQVNGLTLDRSRLFVISHDRIPAGFRCAGLSVVPHDPEAYARALYAEWHRCDDAGASAIVMEELPGTPQWTAIRDRLQRASK